MLIEQDKEVDLKVLVEVYCNKLNTHTPSNKDDLIKMGKRMRACGLLTDKEHVRLEQDADTIAKSFRD